MRTSLAIVLLTLSSCAAEQNRGERTPTQSASLAKAEKNEDPSGDEFPISKPGNNCVQQCVDSRQMQATSIEQIQLDCQKQCESVPEAQVAPTDAMKAVTKGLNEFTLTLYKQTAKKGNAVLSPFSVAGALSLLELGAAGDTAAALHSALGIDKAQSHRHGLADLTRRLRGGTGPVERYGQMLHPHTLRVGNSLWVADGYKLNSDFVSTASTYYDAGTEAIDVTKASETASTINAWVENATAQKIKDIVSPSAITLDTRLILVNAIHFLGRWQEPFFERETVDLPFYVAGLAKTKRVATMRRSHRFQSTQNKHATLVELPYWSTSPNSQLAMTIILPTKRNGLKALEAKLTSELLDAWLSAMDGETMVNVKLPKWKAEASFKLDQPLKDLGLATLFTSDADFSGVSNEEGLSVSSVVHKTFISVDEKGTEAAAATAIMMAGGGMPPKPLDFHADHPFLYLIRDTNTGTILFIGRVSDPR